MGAEEIRGFCKAVACDFVEDLSLGCESCQEGKHKDVDAFNHISWNFAQN